MTVEREPRIRGVIDAEEVHIGEGVVVDEGAVIRGKSGPARRVHLGDHCYVGPGVKVFAPEFVLGDYSKLHERAFCHGEHPIRIGRNCWFGGGVVLDGMGGLDIDDNVGVGAGSQLWTHAQFGDVVEGCRFYSHTYMHVGEDAWFVGHCLVSPVKVEPRAMALLGSVVTSDMKENRIYGGSPAKDLSDKLGFQFEERTAAQKKVALEDFIARFEAERSDLAGRLRAVVGLPDDQDETVTYFDLETRRYTRRRSEAEIAFLKAYVPLVKFTPAGEDKLFIPRPPSAG